ncbi:Lar family restriction alleviation protein [Chromohalobacter canadensis]|uniref:Lar family restriction alleviation protein n=1 Tax=Chromohalobacter canadensis TaxID=141389 RepID=UPI00241068B0|nr:Lar family restriction alleviation protein [Chromohalobacter canadensis]
MNKDGFLPCPFCGDALVAAEATEVGFRAKCLSCIAKSDVHPSIANAKHAWNKRSSAKEKESYRLGWKECRKAMMDATTNARGDA